ncbi:hypothetical protein KSP40_PGU020556 [Platanthera guangdongensis]|uniref:C2 domain-containing protein n=1 Tax=Platanthera guangdongensis TaxID=2320717 RepID=A0ABR2LBK6_9ASPA
MGNVIYKTLNPQWHQTLEFPDTGSRLVFHVKDHNAVLPETSIGDCVVEYEMLPPNQVANKWIPLQGVKTGEIHVQVTRRIPEPQKKQKFSSNNSSSSQEHKVTAKRRRKKPNLTSSLYLTLPSARATLPMLLLPHSAPFPGRFLTGSAPLRPQMLRPGKPRWEFAAASCNGCFPRSGVRCSHATHA